jgi:hypothetical protein
VRPPLQTRILIVALFAGIGAVWWLSTSTSGEPAERIEYSRFCALVEQGQVLRVVLRGQSVKGEGELPASA